MEKSERDESVLEELDDMHTLGILPIEPNYLPDLIRSESYVTILVFIALVYFCKRNYMEKEPRFLEGHEGLRSFEGGQITLKGKMSV